MSDPISIGSSPDWDVSALKDDTDGYTETICIECTNGLQTV